jgi:hypothetical protein
MRFSPSFRLDATSPSASDVQRLISYDYLLVHSADVDERTASLHPAVPFRGTEWLVKRELVGHALDLMFARELIDKKLSRAGITYAASNLTAAFVGLLKSHYSEQLRNRARWLAKQFGEMSDTDLMTFMTENVGKVGCRIRPDDSVA